ncbi:MAG: DUF1993 family protein [Parvibaculaceae bacterium]
MYDASIPVFIHFLNGLAALLRKTEAHAQAKKLDPNAFLLARLFPDMFTFTKQVQLACDFAKGTSARLAGITAPSHPDDEKTFDELHDRIRKTVEFLRSLNKDQFAEAAERAITFKAGGKDLTVKGAQYLSNVGLPNFYFHVTTAYGLLRHNGIEIGKADFLARGLLN